MVRACSIPLTIKSEEIAGFFGIRLDTGCYTVGGSVWAEALPFAFGVGEERRGKALTRGTRMGYRSPAEWARVREAGLVKLARGAWPREVAQELGVAARTVRKWRLNAERAPVTAAIGGGRPRTMAERERTVGLWTWGIARALLPKALEGDVRAAALLVKLMEREEKGDQGKADAGAEAAALGSVQLPWQQDDSQSDEGEGAV